MEPRCPMSDPRPKLAMPGSRIDSVLKLRCSHLVKRCSLENPKRVITSRTIEREVTKNRRRSTMRFPWDWALLLNSFSRSSCGALDTDSFPLLIPVSGEACDILECLDMVWGLDTIRSRKSSGNDERDEVLGSCRDLNPILAAFISRRPQDHTY